MNSFGRLFRVNIYGESHGSSVGVVIDGVRPGTPLCEEDFELDLQRRRAGTNGTTTRIEADKVIIESGVFQGYTTGTPIMLRFLNSNTKSRDYDELVVHPRPSHADFVANVKYDGYQDYRGGGHFSGRLTVGLVAAGVVAKKMLEGVKFRTNLINLGGCTYPNDFNGVLNKVIEAKDSVGGIVSVCVSGVEIGLGEPYFDSLESTIAHLMFSVGGVKGVEFGAGFSGVNMLGSEFNDLIIDAKGKTSTNHNGGINGGISNGNDIIVKAFVKPTPSIFKEQETYSFRSRSVEKLHIEGRHDAAIVLRAMVVLEACVAIALADALLIKNSYIK